MPHRRPIRPLLFVALCSTLSACGGGESAPSLSENEGAVPPVAPPPPAPPVTPSPPPAPPSRVDFGRGTAETFVTVDAAGNATSVGVRLSRQAVEADGLPGEARVIALPANAPPLPYSHVEVDWNPDGHAPAGTYHLPHFDIHFFLIDERSRQQIVAGDRDRMFRTPPTGAVPESYRADTQGFVGMGVHYLDQLAPEFAGGTFSNTFVYGYWDGRLIFQEPMVTKAFLESRADVTLPIRQPAVYPTPGRYPTRYRVRYDATSDSWLITLEGLVAR